LDAVNAAIERPAASVDLLVELGAADMAGVNALISNRMQSPVAVIPALADHLINAGGKRLRPLLTVAAARMAGSRGDACLKLAASVEFIHTATLLHDDVIDSSQLRRGKVAAHLIWGAPSSVLVGDYLFARAFELMVEAGSLRALDILAKAAGVISEGEVLQLTRAHDLNLSKDIYLEIIRAKTAELFAAAAEAGAVSAGAPEDQTRAMRTYGLNLGLAFREGKATLPLLLAIAATGAAEAPFWERTIGRREQTDADFRRAQGLIHDTGAGQATLDLAASFADEAKRALSVMPAGDWRRALEDLADFAVSRRA
jgi:octaprenyl-diphosphate synthase